MSKLGCDFGKLIAWDDSITCETCPIKNSCIYDRWDDVLHDYLAESIVKPICDVLKGDLHRKD